MIYDSVSQRCRAVSHEYYEESLQVYRARTGIRQSCLALGTEMLPKRSNTDFPHNYSWGFNVHVATWLRTGFISFMLVSGLKVNASNFTVVL